MKALLCSLSLLLCTYANAQSNIDAGQLAPPINVTDWVLNVPEDKNFSGKFVVLEFWATWCGPCIAAIPHLNELQEKFQRDDLYFVSITDESLPKINRFLDRLDFNSIVVSDQSKQTHIAFGDGKTKLEAYPMTVLIDPEGIIRWVGEPKQLTSEVMKKFLSRKLAATHLMKKDDAVVIMGEEVANVADGPTESSFLELYRNDDLAYLLEIKRVPAASNSFLNINGNAIFHSGITIPELYSFLFSTTIYESDFLNDQYYSILFIDRNPDDDSINRLEEDIKRSLSLRKEIYEKEVTSYTLDMKSGKRLAPSEGGALYSTNSVSDNFYIFSKFSIRDMLKAVTKKTGTLLYYSGSDNEDHDFVIKIENKKAILESLQSYGFRTAEQRQTIKAVRLVKQ